MTEKISRIGNSNIINTTLSDAHTGTVGKGSASSTASIGYYQVNSSAPEFKFDSYMGADDDFKNNQADELEHRINVGFPPARTLILDLIAKALNTERAIAHQMFVACSLGQRAELLAEAQRMRDSAKDMMIGAWLGFGMSAACIALSTKSLRGATKETKDAAPKVEQMQANRKRCETITGTIKKNEGTTEQLTALRNEKADLLKHNKELGRIAETHTSRSSALAASASSLTAIGNASGHALEATMSARAKDDDAEAKVHAANAQAEQTTRDAASKILDGLRTTFDALIHSMKEIRDAQDQVKANIARNA